MKRCLYCYQLLSEAEQNQGNKDFHPKCSKIFFGVRKLPTLPFGRDDFKEMANQIVINSVAITGVQPKLSLNLSESSTRNSRFTVVGLSGLWGNYILKPPTEQYPELPENEDLTMKLAGLCDIKTAEHTLIRLQSGELAYLTKRFDRVSEIPPKYKKNHVEDFCQLTETMTENKYYSSMEKIGKTIRKFSTNSGLDILSFFELSLFCFLTGNADMHLKNFSLIRTEKGEISFAPAYDLLSTKLVVADDKEEMALTINGKRNRLKKSDFDRLAESLKINSKTLERVYQKFEKNLPALKNTISESFLSEKMKIQYQVLLEERLSIFRA